MAAMAGRGGLAALLLVLLVAAQWAAQAEAKSSSLCSKFPSFCDEAERDDDARGKSTHQRFAETKWRKPKGDTEIRGHLAPKRPLKDTEAVELDDAAAMRAATIREAEEKLRLAEGGRAGGRGLTRNVGEDAFDKRRTVEDARRKAHLIKEARRKRRQRLEEAEAEEDDEDEMVVEVEEDEEEEDHDDDDDDGVVEDDDDSDEDDDEEDSEELVSAEAEEQPEEEEEEEEEYVEEAEAEAEEEEEEKSEEEHEIDLHDDEPEDEEERLARKKIREAVMRRRKWKEEEARMKRREEERKRVEEEQKKRDEDVRKRRIEEMRKKKRQEEEARRQKEDEEERQREEEEERLREEEKAKKEAEIRRVREEREKEERRRLEEKVREERRRRDEEKQKEEERKRELERQALERQQLERHRQELERVEEQERGRKEEQERERKRRAEEDERRKREEEERRRRAEEEERERKRKVEEEEKERKRKLEEEEKERKRKLEEDEKERKRKANEEEKERKRKLDEEEKERKRKLDEEEKERKRKLDEEDRERKRKADEQEKKLKLAEEDSKKRKQEEESKKKKETEVKPKATEKEQDKPKKRPGDDAKPAEKPAAKVAKQASKDDDDDDEEEDLTAYMSGFPEFFAPTADDDVKNEECRKQSRIFVQHLAKYKTWALNMYDATAKLPSGVLSGNAIQLGDFDECLGVDVRLRQRSAAAGRAGKGGDDDEDGDDVLARAASWFADLVRPVLEPVLGAQEEPGLVHIRGQYCLAGVDLELRRNDAALRAALDRTLAHSFLRGSLNDSAHFVPRFRTLGWGVCVPAACSPRDVELALRGAVARFQRSGAWGAGLVRARVGLPRGACRVAPPPLQQRLPPTFFLAAGGLAALLLLALVATVKDAGLEPDELGGLSGVVACFSLRRNWSTLTAQDDPGADDIRCIHGIRSACSLLLYAAHKLVPLAALPFSNRSLLTVLAASPASLLLRGSLMYTDTFLMLSGTLAAFHLSRQLGRGGGLDWAGRLLTRLIRLTPTLGLVTVAYAYLLEHLGTGPLWGQLVEANGRICRDHMWRNLLYVHNLWPFEQMCAPHTHQLALDMQLSLLVPPLVWLLVKAWPLASPVLLVLIGGSTWLRQQAALQHNVSLLIHNGARPADLYRAADVSYIQATHRASAYLSGVALGYLLHRVPKKLQAPRAVLALGWLAAALLAGWALFSQRHVARFDYKLDVADAARFNALAPLAWGAAMAWLIFACYTGHGGWLDGLLCARPLVLLSRISYAFYLVQFLVFFYNAGSVRSQREFSVTAALDLWELVLVLALATVVTLLVELPMQSVRSALGTSKRRQSLKWEPPTTPTTPSPQELAAAYYYNPGSDVYTSSHPKEE